MATSLVTHLISPMKLLSTSNELKVDEHNKHSELNKMHVTTVLYGYIIQAFRLPFTIQHSLWLDDLNTTDDSNSKSTIRRTAMKNTTTIGIASQGS